MSELMKLYNTDLRPAADGGIDLGTSSFRWANLYLSTAIVSDTTTGIKIGTATSQKLSFFNSTPIIQPIGTTDLRTALINLGLYATGGASPLNLNGGALTAASVTDSGLTSGRVVFAGASGLLSDDADMTFATDTLTVTKIAATTFTGNVTISTKDIVTDTSTGTKLATGTTQKLGFWNATPVAQSTGWGSITNVTGDKVYDANSTSVDELADVLGTLIAQLVTYGILGS